MKEIHGICERIRAAGSLAQLDALEKELQSYGNASGNTLRKAARHLVRRRKELRKS